MAKKQYKVTTRKEKPTTAEEHARIQAGADTLYRIMLRRLANENAHNNGTSVTDKHISNVGVGG